MNSALKLEFNLMTGASLTQAQSYVNRELQDLSQDEENRC
jgi:hypothetical protein